MSKIEQASQLVRSGDREQRIRAIRYLGKSDERAALQPLQWAADNEPDAKVRAFAAKALANLENNIDLAEPESVFTSVSPFDDADDPDDAPPPDSPISLKAKEEVKKAMDAHMDGDDPRALKHLQRAKQIDKRIVYDNLAQNIAGAVTGINGKAAMTSLDDPAVKGVTEPVVDGPDWTAAWTDIGIYVLVSAVGIIAVFLAFSSRFSGVLTEIAANPGAYPDFYAGTEFTPEEVQTVVDILQGGVLIIVALTLIYMILSVIGSMIQFFAIHFAAINFFDGKRPTSVTIDYLFNYQTVINVLSSVVALLFVLALPNTIEAYRGDVSLTFLGGQLILLAIFTVILSIATPIGQMIVVARAQKIGLLNGCLSILVGGFLLAVLQFLFTVIFPLFFSLLGALVGA